MRLATKFRLITLSHTATPVLLAGWVAYGTPLFHNSLFQDILGISGVTALLLAAFAPHLVSLRWLVTGQLAKIIGFCRSLHTGTYPHFHLPNETDDENEFLGLMRHMNWMSHQIRIRETELETRVVERTKALETANVRLREARDAADASDRAKGLFLANMSHEIRTPMNAILGMCDLLQRSSLQPSQAEQVRIVQSSTEALLDQVSAILDYSKIDAGHFPLNEAPFRIREVLEAVCDMFATTARSKGIELVVDIETAVPVCVMGDGVRIRQVLTNLVGNALKFTETGEICISVHTTEDSPITFAVQDTGIGIPEDRKTDLFDPFTQADGSITRKYGGTGLGLAICKGIVEQMKGTITLESEEGKGSLFRVTLPLSPLEETAPPPKLPDRLHHMHCLLIEDHPTTTRVIRRYLTDFGFGEESVSTAQAARQRLAEGPSPDLILCDISLPDTDGLALCREMAARLRPTPPILLFGSGPDEEGLAMATPGCIRFLSKPIKQSSLFDTIMEIFGSDTRLRPEAPQSPPPPDLSDLQVLLVEDNAVNRLVAAELLQMTGIGVLTAQTGAEALTLLETETVDAVLMDMQMPGMDGRETTRRIRKIPALHGMPVIAMTADTGEEHQKAARDAGMDAYLTKPVMANTLFSLLCRVTGRPEIPPTSAPPSSPEESPEILDTKTALDRFLGNRELYARVLREFARDQEPVIRQVRSHLASGETEAARIRIHSLKGASGNIGANRLAKAAAAAETALLQQTDAAPLLISCETELKALLALIPEETEDAPVCTQSIRTEDLLAALKELSQELASSSMGAKKTATALEPEMASCGHIREYRRLLDATARYDFQTARTILAEIIEAMTSDSTDAMAS